MNQIRKMRDTAMRPRYNIATLFSVREMCADIACERKGRNAAQEIGLKSYIDDKMYT